MFAHQIFNDLKENTEITTTRDLKSNANGKIKSAGLKNATNTAPNKRITKSDSFGTPLPSFKKNLKKEENPTTSKQQCSTVSASSEYWLEKENMYVYEEPEDDYEDILPKKERITAEEMDCLFETGRLGGLVELTADPLPSVSLELIEDFSNDFCLPSLLIEDLYIDIPSDIPLPDNPFEDDTM